MAFLAFLFFVLFISLLIFLGQPQKRRSLIHKHWPVLGMIPAVLANTHRLHDLTTTVLKRGGGTFRFKGPWFANMDMLITTHPLDVHHILSKNFANYPRGQEYRDIFDVLGDGFVNSEGELWGIHRRTTMSVFRDAGFQGLLETTIWSEVENGLLPVLESSCAGGVEVDLQDVFKRFAFDTICRLILDHDARSLSCDFPFIPFQKAMSDAEEAILHRHITPPSLRKLQKLLRVGNEKKMSDAWKTMDEFIYKCLDECRNKIKDENLGLLTALRRGFEGESGTSGDPKRFLRDTLLTLVGAGKDTTSAALSWFFYLLANSPHVERKIREEIRRHLEVKAGEKLKRFHTKELGKLVYLHGAVMEALRLFPPVPFNNKTPLQPDILPSGHHVDKNTRIILSFYSMARMESIWGEDCMEFKPERWITHGGGIKQEPSYKFTTFNAGPRTCLGKDMSLCQLKIVATTIIHHYHIELVEGQSMVPSGSIILQMKHGLKAKLTKTK